MTVLTTMEILATCFCIVIAHAFGYLEQEEIGKEDLRVSKDASKVVSRYAKQAFNLGRHIRLKDFSITANNITAKSNGIVTSATPTTIVTPLTATLNASQAMNVSAKVLDSSPSASAASHYTITNFLSKDRSLLGRKLINDSIDLYHSNLADTIFKKMPTQLGYAIDSHEDALLQEYSNNRKETSTDETVALSKDASHEDGSFLKQPVAGPGATEPITNYKAVRKGEAWTNEKTNQSFASISRTPSAFLTWYETIRRHVYYFIAPLLNAAGMQKGERAKAEGVVNASSQETEKAKINLTERAREFERPNKQGRKKRQADSFDALKTRDVITPRSPDTEVKEKQDAEKAKNEEDKKGQIKDESLFRTFFKNLGLDVVDSDDNATIAQGTVGNATAKGTGGSRGGNALLLLSIAFAVIVQLIIAIMVLVRYRKEIAEWCTKTKKRKGEKEPLQPAKKVSATKPPTLNK